jgi:hypothetical protein
MPDPTEWEWTRVVVNAIGAAVAVTLGGRMLVAIWPTLVD